VRLASLVLAIAVEAVPLKGDECLAPKNPVKASVVCGRVTYPNGEFVPNFHLQLVRGDEVVAQVQTDSTGDFMFEPVPRGDYDLTTKAEGWYLFWPVTVTSTRLRRHCADPLEVKISLKVCGQGVSKRGYHARF